MHAPNKRKVGGMKAAKRPHAGGASTFPDPVEPSIKVQKQRKGKRAVAAMQLPTELATQNVSGSTSGKTVRRDILVLWADTLYNSSPQKLEEANKQLDRLMIALHRFQTDGKVAYRRLIGMHGGGGGTKDPAFFTLLQAKMNADIKAHYEGKFPDSYYWPEPVPNAAPPKVQDSNNPSPFTYTFCWHQEPQFIVWHRALTAEFERLLQEYDPETMFAAGSTKHNGPAALGLPYWGWEHWDGQNLPVQITAPTYVVRSGAWPGYSKGDSFPNPFSRWFAPVSVEQQLEEYFPPTLTEANCTTRALSFKDPTVPNELPWPIRSAEDGSNPSMFDVVNRALSEEDYGRFATTKLGKQWSIENAHNKFHNHVGGFTLGGVQGPGKQESSIPSGDPENPDYFTGTMTQNQSIFDPIFWLHHSNVERQLCSWQRAWPKSKPSEDMMNTVLYPWTKPNLLAENNYSWNTPTGKDNDATLADWFNAELTYVYDELLFPIQSFPTTVPAPVRMALATASIRKEQPQTTLVAHVQQRQRGGEFSVEYDGKLVVTMSILSALGSGCARCAQRERPMQFDVSHFGGLTDLKKLVLKRNGRPVSVEKWSLAQ